MSESIHLNIDGREAAVTVRRSGRAKRMSLRADGVRGAVLVLPPKITIAQAERFVRSHLNWLAERLAAMPQPARLIEGAVLPILGEDHEIRRDPAARRGVWRQDGIIWVSGAAEFVERRAFSFIKAEARKILPAKVRDMAAKLNCAPARISVKDTVSRWGSCSAQGHVAVSWRLIMAPEWVADYVCAHEAAHLRELNHSPAFWALVAGLGVDHHAARTWLKANGAHLHRLRGKV